MVFYKDYFLYFQSVNLLAGAEGFFVAHALQGEWVSNVERGDEVGVRARIGPGFRFPKWTLS